MIITKLRLQEEHPMTGPVNSWPLPICDLNLNFTAGENGYILKEVEGLDPPDLVAIVEGFDSLGTPIMGSIPEKREIVLKIGFNPGLGQSYSSLRDNLYKLIDRSVFVKLMDDSIVIAQTTGHIRQFEAVHFSNQPEITITIECNDGEFSSPNSIAIPFSDLGADRPIINYEEGTAPAGLELQFTYTAVAAGTGFIIFNHSRIWYSGVPDVYNVFELSYPFVNGDIITISTQPRNKRITLLRDSVLFDIAGNLNAGAIWPKLFSGVNTFEWSFDPNWMSWISASYIPKYWGV